MAAKRAVRLGPRIDYNLNISRVASAQTDLFAPAQPNLFTPVTPDPSPSLDPIAELQKLLDKVRRASVLPWTDAAEAMGEEYRALWLGRQAGDEGARLPEAIFEETVRLFSVGEQSPPKVID